MSHLTIRGLLQQRLAAWATTKGLPVAWQGVSFAPPSGMYLRVFMLPAGTSSIDLEGVSRTYTGVFQVSIVAPNGKGTGAAEALVPELDALFPMALRLTSDSFAVQVSAPVTQGPIIHGDINFTVPVSFQYRADT